MKTRVSLKYFVSYCVYSFLFVPFHVFLQQKRLQQQKRVTTGFFFSSRRTAHTQPTFTYSKLTMVWNMFKANNKDTRMTPVGVLQKKTTLKAFARFTKKAPLWCFLWILVNFSVGLFYIYFVFIYISIYIEWKVFEFGGFYELCFPAFKLNMQIWRVHIHIYS